MARFFRRRKFCRFTAEGVKEIDYKDLNTLKAYVTETGKIVPSRITVASSAAVHYDVCPKPYVPLLARLFGQLAITRKELVCVITKSYFWFTRTRASRLTRWLSVTPS